MRTKRAGSSVDISYPRGSRQRDEAPTSVLPLWMNRSGRVRPGFVVKQLSQVAHLLLVEGVATAHGMIKTRQVAVRPTRSRTASRRSGKGEHWWEDDHDRGGPQGEGGKVGGLPALEPVERAVSCEESGGEQGGPGQVHE
jgi:hypothetical protein